MAVIFKIEGQEKTYKVKSYEELTLGDWKDLTGMGVEQDPLKALDMGYKLLERHTGIKTKLLHRLPTGEVQKLLDALGESLVKAHQGTQAFNKALEEDEAGYVPPKTIKVGKDQYSVPYDLEFETVYGQWADWNSWDVPEHESDLVAEVLAFMLVKVGEEYGGTPKAKVAQMMDVPMAQAFDLCAFFFARSARFRLATSQRSRAFVTLMNAQAAKVLRLSPEDTGALLNSWDQRGSSTP
jgi:hypothetical protein